MFINLENLPSISIYPCETRVPGRVDIEIKDDKRSFILYQASAELAHVLAAAPELLKWVASFGNPGPLAADIESLYRRLNITLKRQSNASPDNK